MAPSDQDLCRSAAGGDHAAFHALVDRHAPALFRVALSMSGSRADAEDICQETFVAAFRSLKRFDGRASVKTWLTRILMCRAATSWKQGRHGRRAIALHQVSEAQMQRGADCRDSLAEELSVPASTMAVDSRLDILEAIRSLPPEFRDTVVLREIRGMSYEEIATALGVPRGTVESRLHRARAELARKLTGY